MSDLSITLVQCNQFWEDKHANLAQYDKLLATVSGTDLILLPEMFHTGFSMNAEALKEDDEQHLGLDWLKSKAAEKNAAIYTSYIYSDGIKTTNRGVFVRPNGTVEHYDKRKTFTLAGESKYYSKGTLAQIVELKGWKINLQICFDLRFPEQVRNTLDAAGNPSYDLLLYVANWPERRRLHWSTLLRARSIENQCVVAGLNRVGTDNNNLVYSGDSAIFDALGTDLTEIEPYKEEVKTITVSLEDLKAVRQQLPFLSEM